MDIFSSTSKQVESAVSTPKTQAPTQTREVENSHQIAKSARDNEQKKDDIAQKLTETEAMALSEKMQEIIGTIFDKKG